MIEDGAYFENQKDIINKGLLTSKRSIKIAVAWINFDDYKDTLILLLNNRVKIKIAVNDDVKNRKYTQTINELIYLGAKIKFISMPSKYNYMHHKFCIIDNKFFMSGSFNWTKNANNNNYENLIVSHNLNLLRNYISEFKAVWQLSKNDLKMLKKPNECEMCGNPKIIICVFIQDGICNTKADIYKVCTCEIDYITSDYFDISVYSNLMGIFEKYSDMDEYYYQHGYDYDKKERSKELYFEIEQYLSTIRGNRMNFPIIHAVGVYSWRWFDKDDGENIIRVLWKEKYTSNYILDKYSLNEVL
ncbi:phospholipase D-like domain-containing protein [Romboutsia sp.]|uniref:phospholipase D-like domain-containing protein n=1 Tax=Romboutsia sp. TaxID=1965302 RepID=UPI003F2D6134